MRGPTISPCLAGVLTLATAGMVSPLNAAGTPRRMVDHAAEGRYELSIVAGRDAGSRNASSGGRLDHGLLAYRFSVELVDSLGRVVETSVEWAASLRVGAGAMEEVARLSSSNRSLAIPRPLGIRLNAADSLLFAASGVPGELGVRLTIEYEPGDQPTTRLAVLPRSAQTTGEGSSWSWTADRGGRLLALAAAQIDGLVAMELHDITTGDLVWAIAMVRSGQPSFSAAGSVIRLGVQLRAGHTYRLSATWEGGPRTAVPSSLTTMLLPDRPAR